jgi:hypothetical protein
MKKVVMPSKILGKGGIGEGGNKHPYSLGHRGMKGDHKDEKSCHAIQDSVEGRNWGSGIVGGCGMKDVKTLGC